MSASLERQQAMRRENRAKENRQRSSGDTNVHVTVNAEGATKRDVEKAMDRAKREAVKEVERKVSETTSTIGWRP